MKEPFKRESNRDKSGLTLTAFIPEAAENAEWFFTQPSIATREYNGYLMRHTLNGWEYYKPFEVYYDFPGDPHQITGATGAEWCPVYPKASFFRQVLQVLTNTWRVANSPFTFVDQFENAESPFTDEYELGEYWLVAPEKSADPFFLVPVNKAEQLSNINELELHKMDTVEETFYALQDALYLLRETVYGVIFTNANGKRMRVRPRDFDWSDYDD